jgi:hypothetical protein
MRFICVLTQPPFEMADQPFVKIESTADQRIRDIRLHSESAACAKALSALLLRRRENLVSHAGMCHVGLHFLPESVPLDRIRWCKDLPSDTKKKNTVML